MAQYVPGSNWFIDTFGQPGALPSPGSVVNSGASEFSLDASGYDQAEWDLEKTKELLEEQRAYNSAEAQKTKDWQEYMSNTAYQRAVKDIEAAGLNKWLAVQNGSSSAASTPSGATATSSAGDASTPNPALMKEYIKLVSATISSAFGFLGKIA